MKTIVTLLLLCLPCWVIAGELIVEGVYQGKSLYIQNPLTAQGRYCITSIRVNGQKYPTEEASAFQLNFLSLKVGAPLKIVIQFINGATPRIINPQVIQKKEAFQFLSVSVDEKQIEWQSNGTEKHGRFFIMKQEIDHADMLYVVDVDTKLGDSAYQLEMQHTFGNNTYFIKYLHYAGAVYYSERMHFYSDKPDTVSFYPKDVKDFITFSEEVNYTITDEKGKLIKQGVAQKVNCSGLKAGTYFIDLNNKKNQFVKM